MATPTTIHKQLYVTIQYRGDANNESGLLGFASPYTKDAPFAKRKSTQDSWAYGHGATVTIDENDDVTVTGSGTRGGYGSGQKWDATMLFMANCYPRIVPNEPVEGFEIAKSVRRYGWNGGGNVKWRITDPRGFDLEISSENFASVLDCCDVSKGVILGKCVWGRMGNNNILLPEASTPYQEAVAHTAKKDIKISLKEVGVGDTVEILSNNVPDEDKVAYYYGKYWFLTTAHGDGNNSYNGSPDRLLNGEQCEHYLLKSVATNRYYVLTAPKVVDIVNKRQNDLSKAAVAATVNEQLSRSVGIDEFYNGLTLISPTKIKLDQIASMLAPLNEKITGDWPTVGKYGWVIDNIIAKYEDRYYVASISGNGYSDPKKAALMEIDVGKLGENKVSYRTTAVKGSRSYWSGHNDRYERITRTDFKFEDLELFRIVVATADGFHGNVYQGL
jgi:hypothetical protein